MFFSRKLDNRGETGIGQTVMVAGLIIAAFFIGMLWTKVQTYEKGGTGKANIANGAKVGTTNEGIKEAFNEPPAPQVDRSKIAVDPITDSDMVRGNRNARVALVEYSDLECPFCKRFHDTAKQMITTYGDKVSWVYRHFPLDQLHPKARAESAAAECAKKLGGEDKFWSFIDKVYEITPANNGLDPAKLPEIAGQIGLNVNSFNTCAKSQEAAAAVEAQYQSGIKAGIQGTPGNILLDTKTGKTYEIPGAVPFNELKTMIDDFVENLDK